MNLSLTKLKNVMPDLNTRALDEKDFWRVCDEQCIDVRERRYNRKGYYVCDKSGDYVFIDSRLKNLLWLEVAFHELFHALLHFPSPFLYHKQQFEASAFTLIALCPLNALKSGELVLQAKHDRRLRFIIRERERLYFLYGV